MSYELNKQITQATGQTVRTTIFEKVRGNVLQKVETQVRDPVGRSVNMMVFHQVRGQIALDVASVYE